MNTIAVAMIILILICPRISRSPITAVIMDLKLIIVVVNIVLITITVIAITIITIVLRIFTIIIFTLQWRMVSLTERPTRPQQGCLQ